MRMEHNNLLNSLVLLIAPFLIIGCVEPLIDVYVDNKSNDSIVVSMSFDPKFGVYPDTVLKKDTIIYTHAGTPYRIIDDALYRKIGPHEKKILYECLVKPRIEVMCVFVISQDTLNKYSWNEIRSTNNYLVRYDYTREQFEGLDYTIIYPPTLGMKDIHMYPEFSTFYKSNE